MADNQPTIVWCARAGYPGFAALHYAEFMGFSVIPCDGKKPAVDWKPFQHRAATGDLIRRWSKENLFGNVGIICGAASHNLVVIDLDGEAAIGAFLHKFPQLQDTYAVTSGSGTGMHLYYFVRDLPPTTRVTGLDVGNIELRANGTYVVAPPSIHPSGKPYSVRYPRDIAYLQHMRPQVEWIKSLIASKHGGKMPPAANANGEGKEVRHATSWARAALIQEANKVQYAAAGGQNVQLNLSAFKLGQIVGQGHIDRTTVEEALYAAAASSGYVARDGEAQTRRTIKSGLDAGISNPRK